jgi:hypothetical protein
MKKGDQNEQPVPTQERAVPTHAKPSNLKAKEGRTRKTKTFKPQRLLNIEPQSPNH